MQLNRYYLTGFRYVSLFTLQREEGKVEEGKGGREGGRKREKERNSKSKVQFFSFFASAVFLCLPGFLCLLVWSTGH
jgi:hypothetical protein